MHDLTATLDDPDAADLAPSEPFRVTGPSPRLIDMRLVRMELARLRAPRPGGSGPGMGLDAGRQP